MFRANNAFFITITACLLQLAAMAQSPEPSTEPAHFKISRILISGNKKTKNYIILRELSFKEGDSTSISDLVAKFEYARQQLYNTRLFNDVIVNLKSFSGYDIDVEITVKERWYIFPIPYVRPADRNLSAWADRGYSLSRLNLGLKFSYYNFSGRNDKLKAWLIGGYSRQIRFSYEQPYTGGSLKHGYLVNVGFARFREINALTVNNRQLFLKSDTLPTAGRYLDDVLNLTVGYTYRPAIKTRHVIKLGYVYNKVDSVVTALNPNFFKNNRSSISYPELRYSIDYNNMDYLVYPLNGVQAEAGLVKKGFTEDMNLLELYLKGTRAWKLAKKTSYNFQGYFSLKLPFDQPFYNRRQMGYEDVYLRGLEKYVIDGVSVSMARNTLKYEFLHFTLPTYLKSRTHDRVPFKFYLKAFGDAGYVYTRNAAGNNLVNKLLYTAGAGIDMVTLYDVVIRFEYSFNQLGENGLFLHFKNEF